jgi:hypothetical protein
MWYQHALHEPADFVAHQPAALVPRFTHFHERITLIVEIDSTTIL